ETSLASVPNSARPHGRASDRVIGRGDTVIIDTGCIVDGYTSDYTRTLTTGFVEGPVHEAYALVLAAQQAGFDALRAGAKGVDADAAARRIVDSTGFAGVLGQGTRHRHSLDIRASA